MRILLFRPTLALLGSGLLLALPIVPLLSGCNGGSSSRPSERTFNSTLAVSNGTIGQVQLKVRGNRASGTFNVPAVAAAASSRTFSFSVPNGQYPFTGTFTAPASFSVSGTIPGLGTFTIVGELPTNGGSGNYTITINGETITGNFLTGNNTPTPAPTGAATATPRPTATPGATATPGPSPSPTPHTTATPSATATPRPTATPIATATPHPTATPVAGNNNQVTGLTFSSLSNVNGNTTVYSATLPSNQFFKNNTSGFSGTAFFEVKVGAITRKLTFEGPTKNAPVKAGDVINLGGGGEGEGAANLYYSEANASGLELRSWAAQSGTYRVTAASATKVSFSLEMVKFAPSFNPGNATGTFILSGRGSVGQ